MEWCTRKIRASALDVLTLRKYGVAMTTNEEGSSIKDAVIDLLDELTENRVSIGFKDGFNLVATTPEGYSITEDMKKKMEKYKVEILEVIMTSKGYRALLMHEWWKEGNDLVN